MQQPANRFIKAPVALRFEVTILLLKNLHAVYRQLICQSRRFGRV